MERGGEGWRREERGWRGEGKLTVNRSCCHGNVHLNNDSKSRRRSLNGWRVILNCVDVHGAGSFDTLYQSFPATKAKQAALEREVVHTFLLQSFRVWCKRNGKEPATSHVAAD